MPEKKSKNIADLFDAISFTRSMSKKGEFTYEFTNIDDRDILGLPSVGTIEAGNDGCLTTVGLEDRDNLSNEIKSSLKTGLPTKEMFRVINSMGENKWFYGKADVKKKKDGSAVWTGTWIDVTPIKSQEFFKNQIIQSLPDSLIVFDKSGMVLAASNQALDLLETDELVGCSIFSKLPDNISENLQQHLLLSAIKEKSSFSEWLKKSDGRELSLKIDVIPKGRYFICILHDISDEDEKENSLKYMAFHDNDTGIENYAYLQDAFPKLVDTAKVNQTQIAVLSVAPDSLGQIGSITDKKKIDALKIAMADRIRACLKPNDLLAWTGYYHFTVLLTDIEFSIEIEQRIEKIINGFKETIVIDDANFDFTASVGVCFYPQNGKNLDDLIRNSDLALQKAFEDKNNSMRLYSSDFSVSQTINLGVRKRLKEALANDEIFCHFQPQVDIRTGQIVGFEALARWKTADGNYIPPCDFIPEAEEFGLIDSLTNIVLNKACEYNQKWYSMGLCRVPVAVNLSARQFHNGTQLLKMVNNILDNTGLPPYLLELELTESSAMCDPKNAVKIFQDLLDNNIRCALDDFGTGYSSLSVLRSFPLKKLKIDRSFILELNDKKNMEIVRATIAMAHALDLVVLAEGVETRKNYEILKELGCDVIQGYLFSQPLCAEEMELLLMRWDAGQVS